MLRAEATPIRHRAAPHLKPVGACACGGGCPRCRNSGPKVASPRDAAEAAADRAARLAADPAHADLSSKPISVASGGISANAPRAPASVDAVVASPGQALDDATRRHFESRFGRGFGAVRLHADDLAAGSARALHAHAYTVGTHIAFAAGAYDPHTQRGRRLLAHELAHVVQQQASGHPPWVQRAWNACASADQCPAREPGEEARARAAPLQVMPLNGPVRGLIVYPFPIGGTDASALAADPQWATHMAELESGGSSWEILGLSDCDGSAQTNQGVRQARAESVLGQCSPTARQHVLATRALPLEDCVGDDLSEEDRALNRSVVLVAAVPPVTAPGCPPQAPIRAASISDYLSLVMCVEQRFPGYSPREMLSLLRQFYYGSAPWSNQGPPQWDQIIPCGLRLPDPRPVMGNALVQSLRQSQEVEGIDVGHVFTGLEAMVCPATSVTPRINPPHTPGWFPDVPTIEVRMTNEILATWGGDIGAAAEEQASAAIDNPPASPWSCYFGGPAGGSCPRGSLQASHADLEGDIDAFAIRAGLAGQSCAQSELQPLPALSQPISQILFDHYLATPETPAARSGNSRRCMLRMLGGVFAGNRLVNRDEVVERISPWVLSFAAAARMGRTRNPSLPANEAMLLDSASRDVSGLFVDWLAAAL